MLFIAIDGPDFSHTPTARKPPTNNGGSNNCRAFMVMKSLNRFSVTDPEKNPTTVINNGIWKE